MAISTVTWNSASSGNWTDTTWTGGVAPGTGAANTGSIGAAFTGSNTYTVTLGPTTTINLLTAGSSAGNFGLVLNNANAQVVVQGTMSIGAPTSSATLSAASGNLLVSNTSATAGAALVRANAYVVSGGTITVTNGGTTNAATLIAGTSTTTTTGAISISSGVLNIGTVGTDTAIVKAGGLTLSGGRMVVNTGGTSSLASISQTGAATNTLLISNGSVGLGAGALGQSGAGANTLEVAGGALSTTGTLTQNGASSVVKVSGGTLSVGALTHTSGQVLVSSGSLANSGSWAMGSASTLNISGGQVSIGGALTQSTSTIAFSGNGTLQLTSVTGSATVNFGGLANQGTLFWNNTTLAGLSSITLADFWGDSTNKDVLRIATSAAATVTTSWTRSSNSVGTLGVTSVVSGVTSTAAIQITSSNSLLPTGNPFAVQNVNAGYFEIVDTFPCFLRGTRITTLRGDVPVEALRVGDLVVTATGGALPVKWIGTRAYIAKLVSEHHRTALMPIRIAAGALGESSPVRDLFVSPEHMLAIDGVLVPAEKLLNGTSVTRADGFDVVQYFHVELTQHSVLFAEGAPAESFLDTGNRNMFSNVLSYLDLGYSLEAPAAEPCLPVVTEGEALAAIRAQLAARAVALGLETTADADLHLLADGAALQPEAIEDGVARFAVPAGLRSLRIASRAVVPADLDPANGDRRRLGVCLTGIALRDAAGFAMTVAPGHAALAEGFHAAEPGHRWTDGDAALPAELLAAMPEGFTLELTLVETGLRYPVPASATVVPLATVRARAAQLPERRIA